MKVGTSQELQPLQILMMPDYRIDNPYQSLLAQALEVQGVRVSFPRGYRRVLPISRAIKTSRVPIDVIHLHWLGPYMKGKGWLTKLIYAIKLLIDIRIARGMGVKVVWTIHNRISHDSQFPNLELWTRRRLVQLADRIVLHHHSTLEAIAQDYQLEPSKVEVIPIGHYRSVYQPAIEAMEARKKLQLPLTGRIYLHQGMLRPYKGIDRLLKVWRDRRGLLKEDTLLIAGKALDPEYALKLTQLVSGIEGVILYPEFIEDEQMHLFFSAANVVVLPFDKILTSSSLIVAMSYGKPIIAPQLGGISETLGSANSLLYDPDDEQGLSGALEKSTWIDLEALGKRVTEACDRLDWNSIGERMVQTYFKTAIKATSESN